MREASQFSVFQIIRSLQSGRSPTEGPPTWVEYLPMELNFGSRDATTMWSMSLILHMENICGALQLVKNRMACLFIHNLVAIHSDIREYLDNEITALGPSLDRSSLISRWTLRHPG